MRIEFIPTVAVLMSLCLLTVKANADDAALVKSKFEVLQGEARDVSVMDVLTSLRKQGVKANLEKLAGLSDSRVAVEKGALSFDELFRHVLKELGYSYEISGGVVTLFSPSSREFGEKHPLAQKIDKLEIKDLTLPEAIEAIGRKCDVALVALELSNHPNVGKKVNVSFHDITVREALSKLENAVGGEGWVSDVSTIKADGALPRIVVRVIM